MESQPQWLAIYNAVIKARDQYKSLEQRRLELFEEVTETIYTAILKQRISPRSASAAPLDIVLGEATDQEVFADKDRYILNAAKDTLILNRFNVYHEIYSAVFDASARPEFITSHADGKVHIRFGVDS